MTRMIVALGFLGLMLGGGRAFAQDPVALYTQKCANCHAKDGSGHTGVASKLIFAAGAVLIWIPSPDCQDS